MFRKKRPKAGLLYAAMVGGAVYIITGQGRIKLFRQQLVADLKADRFTSRNILKAAINAHKGIVPGETIVETLPAPQQKQ